MKLTYIYKVIIEDHKAEEIMEEDRLESVDEAAKSYFRNIIECDPYNMYVQEPPKYKEFVGVIYGDWELYHDYGAGYYFAMIVK